MTIAVLFVCLGNICRSPLAEAAFRAEAERLGLDVEVDSAGTGDWHVGEPPDRRAQAVARAQRRRHLAAAGAAGAPRGLSTASTISSRSTGRISPSSRRCARRTPAPGCRCCSTMSPGREGEAVADPYYGGEAHFDVTWTRRQRRRARRWRGRSARGIVSALRPPGRRSSPALPRTGSSGWRPGASPKCCWCGGPTGRCSVAKSGPAARRRGGDAARRSPAPAFPRRRSRASMTACCCSSMSRMTACSAPRPGPISAPQIRRLHDRTGESLWLAGRLCARHGRARQSREPRLAALLGRAKAGRDRRPARPALARAGGAAGGRGSATCFPADPPRRLAARRSVDRQHPGSGRPARRPGRSRLLSWRCRGRPGDARPVRLAARRVPRGLWPARAGLARAAAGLPAVPGAGPCAALGTGLFRA